MQDTKKNIQRVEEQLLNALRQRENRAPQKRQDDLWNKFIHASKGAFSPHFYKSINSKWLITTAACCLFFISIAGWHFYTRPNNDFLEMIAHLQNDSLNLSPNVMLITPSGHKIDLPEESKRIKQTVDGIIKVDNKLVAEQHKKRDNEPLKYTQVVVPYGKHIQLVLSDGSLLDVNSATKVIYPTTFKKDCREIFVQGEIFIDVKKKNNVPFVVKTPRFDVNVLGTAFNVRAYAKSDKAEVVLQRGKVEISDSKKNVIKMVPNELVVINQGKIATKSNVDVSRYLSWKDGILHFEGENLEQVAQRLSQFYGIPIVCEEDIKAMTLFGKLDINEPMESVLSSIVTTSGVVFEKVNSSIYLRKKEIDTKVVNP